MQQSHQPKKSEKLGYWWCPCWYPSFTKGCKLNKDSDIITTNDNDNIDKIMEEAQKNWSTFIF